jgi:hypothetical protein
MVWPKTAAKRKIVLSFIIAHPERRRNAPRAPKEKKP